MMYEIKLKSCLLFLLGTASINNSIAQSKSLETESSNSYTNAYFGFGIGQDYGAIGIRAEFLPSKYIGIFGGAGYALIDPAFNVGVSAKLSPGKKLCPTLIAMYGYNAVIEEKDFYGSTMASSKIYYGPTFGAGGELKIDKHHDHKLGFNVFVPIRSSQFHKDYNALKDAGYTFKPDILSVTFSIGVNFGIGTNKNKK